MKQLLERGSDAYVVEKFFGCRPFLVQATIVAFSVDIIADEPAHSRARHDITRKVLASSNSSHHNGGGCRVDQDRNDSRVRILVSDY